jgi:hypothetical protein
LHYTVVPPSSEISEEVFRLYSRIYGDPQGFINRWEWEFMQHPRSRDIALYCAKLDGELTGITVRHPVTILYRGQLIEARFASNSMVIPEARGRGIIRELYQMAAANGALQLSKGTATGMYTVLKKIGYRDIFPSTFQINYLRPFRLLLRKLLGMQAPGSLQEIKSLNTDAMSQVDTIPEDIASMSVPDGIIKDVAYLCWRYIAIPHKQYRIFVRRVAGNLVSLLILRADGSTVYLVDSIWNRDCHDEPATSLSFAKEVAMRMGASRLKAWCTASEVRSALGRLGFVDKGESPRFSYYSTDPALSIDWHRLNLTHGEGDIDYL